MLEIHPFDAEQRGVRDGDLVALQSRIGEISLHAKITERVQPGVVYTTFHHAETGANVVTTDYSDWATNCPEYKVTAVQVRRTNHFSDWQVRDREEGVSLRRIDEGIGRCGRVTRRARSTFPSAPSPTIPAPSGRSSTRAVAVEAPVQIVIGGAPFAVMMATPSDLEDFAAGFALTEQIAESVADIRGVEVEAVEDGWKLKIAISGRAIAGPSRARPGDERAHRLWPLRHRGFFADALAPSPASSAGPDPA